MSERSTSILCCVRLGAFSVAIAALMPCPVVADPARNCFPRAQLAGPQAAGPQLVDYPAASVAAHEQGHALISYTVRIDGTVEAIRLEQTSGHARLDSAAIAAPAAWHFDTSGMNAQYLPMHSTQYVDFTLAADGSAHASAGNVCLTPPPVSARAIPRPAGPHALIYPLGAISALEEGHVTVGFKILADGSVAEAAVLESSGHQDLDQAALDSVRAWRYQPISEPFSMTQTLTFSPRNLHP